MDPVGQITAEHVQSEVSRFWNALTSKSAESVRDFYSEDSTVFSTNSSRPEPGRLAAMRREREYFQAQSTLHAQLGPIDVHIVDEKTGIAAYTFQFHASRARIGIEKTSEEHVISGRATQVFHLDPDGRLRIVHEHLSVLHRI